MLVARARENMNSIKGFIAKTGVTYRILVQYNKERHVLLRLQVSKDASLYLFDHSPEQIKHGTATIKSGSTSVTVNTTQGIIIEEPSTLETDHHSFHGSGQVKTPTGRFLGYPLRELEETSQVCSLLFPHISKLPLVNIIRKSDITIDYPLDETCPLVVGISAAPRNNFSLLNVPTATFQWSYAFCYENLLKNDDFLIILHFYHGPGEWPLFKTIIHPITVNQVKKSDSS